MPKIINGVTCRTRKESLMHIMDQARKGKIGPTEKDDQYDCSYRYPSGNCCAVGSLFSKQQLKDIKDRNLNDTKVFLLASRVGESNITTVTGMTVRELDNIQRIHDTRTQSTGGAQKARIKLIEYCERELQELKSTPSKV